MKQVAVTATAGTEMDVHALIEVVFELADDQARARRSLREWAISEIRASQLHAQPSLTSPAAPARRGPGRPRKNPLFSAEGPKSPHPSPEAAQAGLGLAPAPEADLGDFIVLRGEKWLDTKGAAALLKMSPKTLANWRSRNLTLPDGEWVGPPYQRLALKPRYRLNDLEAWVAKEAV